MKTNKKFNPPCYEAIEYYRVFANAVTYLRENLITLKERRYPKDVLDEAEETYIMAKDLRDYIRDSLVNSEISYGDFIQLKVNNPF